MVQTIGVSTVEKSRAVGAGISLASPPELGLNSRRDGTQTTGFAAQTSENKARADDKIYIWNSRVAGDTEPWKWSNDDILVVLRLSYFIIVPVVAVRRFCDFIRYLGASRPTFTDVLFSWGTRQYYKTKSPANDRILKSAHRNRDDSL